MQKLGFVASLIATLREISMPKAERQPALLHLLTANRKLAIQQIIHRSCSISVHADGWQVTPERRPD